MRRRGYAVHASTFDEYKTMSIEDPAKISPYRSPLQKAKTHPEDGILGGVKSKREALLTDASLWSDFDYKGKGEDPEDSEEMSQASTVDPCESPLLRFSLDSEAKSLALTYSILVIGAKGTEVQKFVHGLFGDQIERNSVSKDFDLVIKEWKEQQQRFKFKFWVQSSEYRAYQTIMRVYYATIRYYIFIYKPHDRKSYELLVNSLETVKASTNQEKFIGVLIADSTESKNKEVSEEEAEQLRLKYGLCKRIEMRGPLEETRQEIFKAFNCKLEPRTEEFSLSRLVFKPEDG